MRFLCCDLGGTTADWAVYDTTDSEFIFSAQLKTSEHDDFYAMMDHFLVEYADRFEGDGYAIENATFGVAGPTNNENVVPTNIPSWSINTVTINSILNEHGHDSYSSIINDFEALGYGILFKQENEFAPEDYTTIHGRFRTAKARVGESVGTRSIVCGPGTGLGVACLVEGLEKDGFPYIFSSEGGHHTLAPESIEQLRMLAPDGIFREKLSYEHVLSHTGLQNIYNFFRKADYGEEQIHGITSKEILFLAASNNDQAASDTIELFCELLANFCGNLALTFNCDRAIFLWGGALRKMPFDLIKTRFQKHYANRCQHSTRVNQTPVVLLNDEKIPLLGCVHRSSFEVKYLKPKD